MIDTGVLTDYTNPEGASGGGELGSELDNITIQQSVDQELAKMKAERQVTK
jgi:hypothetical protein